MYYKYKLELDGKIVDQSNEELSKLVTLMWINLYEKYKNNPKIFAKQ